MSAQAVHAVRLWRDAELDVTLSGGLGGAVALVLAEVAGGEERRVAHEILERVCAERGWELPASWPHPRVSLSHTRGWVAVLAASGQAGVGVDIEHCSRSIDPRAARWFLTDEERSRTPDLLTAWTLKEAVFKADPQNHARNLGCYESAASATPASTARSLEDGRRFRTFTLTTHGLRLSAALSPQREESS